MRKIVELRASNVKRLSAVEIKPDGSLVIIGGKNAAGKSSVLDAIVFALNGAGAFPSKPVRNGEKQAEIEITLDGEPGIVVKRRITDDGKTTLEVRQVSADGMQTRVMSPQKLLDSLCGRIAFDPLAFTRMRPQDQIETLRGVVGIDLADLDAQIARLFEERTAVNRQQKELKAQLDSAKQYDDAPAEPVSVDALLGELEEAQATNREAGDVDRQVKEAEHAIQDAARDVRHASRHVEDSKRALADAEANLKAAIAYCEKADEEAKRLRVAADAMPRVECDPIHARLRSAEEINGKVRANAARKQIGDDYAAGCGASEGLSDKIETLRGQRIDRMNNAPWPVTGLGFDADGVTYGGLPFDQCSSAEQLRISTAIGLAQHPNLRVLLIRDGSLLDADNLAAIAELAEEHEAQVWLERVGDGAECSVIIEDGTVVGAPVEELAVAAES